MAGQRLQQQNRGDDQKASGARRTARRKAEQPVADEELGPERRIELARELAADRSRGKPPSL